MFTCVLIALIIHFPCSTCFSLIFTFSVELDAKFLFPLYCFVSMEILGAGCCLPFPQKNMQYVPCKLIKGTLILQNSARRPWTRNYKEVTDSYFMGPFILQKSREAGLASCELQVSGCNSKPHPIYKGTFNF